MQIQKSQTNGASANTESSVLFSLASLAKAAPASVPAAKPAPKAEDLFGIGALPSPALAPALAAPVVLAAPPSPARSARTILVAASIVAVAILGGSYAAARAVQPRPVVVSAHEVALTHEITPPHETTPAHETTTVAPEAVPVPVPPAAPVAVALPPTPHGRPRHAPVVVPVPPVDSPPAPTHALPRTIEELMAETTHTPPLPPVAPPRTPVVTLPPRPERADVSAAMAHITPTVSACGPEHGIATVQVTVSHTGRVTSALVSGPLAGTTAGSCVARAARTATFPGFAQDSFSFSYPFRL